MAYHQALAGRIREYLADQPDVVEKKMFGGLAFMWRGNMLCGVDSANMMLRVGPDQFGEALASPGARVMDLTGRPMKGWVMVDHHDVASDKALERWLQMAMSFVSTLPAK